jgi:hypothetical protein
VAWIKTDEDLIDEMGETFSQEKMLGGSRFLAQVERVVMGLAGVG